MKVNAKAAASVSAIVFLICECLQSGSAFGQNPVLQRSAPATVTFTFANGQRNPRFYSVTLGSAGDASYQSTPRSVTKTGVPYLLSFTVTDCTREKIFRLVQQLNLLGGLQPKISDTRLQTMSKTLSFREGNIEHQVSYRHSRDRRIEQLTAMFEKISATLEFGRRLSSDEQHAKHALAPELRAMQLALKAGSLLQVQALRPILTRIQADPSLSANARREAESVLRKIGS